MEPVDWSNKPYLGWLTLFVSATTLLCCALPILLVSLGFGAVVAGIFYELPGLVLLAENKAWSLALSAGLLALLGWIVWRPGQACPADPRLAAYCSNTRRWNRRIFWIGAGIWVTGFFFSYLLLPLRLLLDV